MMLVPSGNHLDQLPDLDVWTSVLIELHLHFCQGLPCRGGLDIQIDEMLHLSYLMLMHPSKCITWSIQDICNPIVSFLSASFSAVMRLFRVSTLRLLIVH